MDRYFETIQPIIVGIGLGWPVTSIYDRHGENIVGLFFFVFFLGKSVIKILESLCKILAYRFKKKKKNFINLI